MTVITKPTFRLADRFEVQRQRCRDREYIVIGKLFTVIFERKLSTPGYSQSQAPASGAFSEAQRTVWQKITLDWLHHKKAPLLAVSRDRHDLLLPLGVPPLPDLPDPCWVPKKASEKIRRVPQRMEDNASGKITGKNGQMFLIFHPVIELAILLPGFVGGFGKIRGLDDPADGTHLTLFIDPHSMEGYFAGGRFQVGSA